MLTLRRFATNKPKTLILEGTLVHSPGSRVGQSSVRSIKSHQVSGAMLVSALVVGHFGRCFRNPEITVCYVKTSETCVAAVITLI